MVKIVGFKHSEGSFTSDDKREIIYNNIVLYYMFDSSRNVVGIATGEFKIAFDKCCEITGFDYANLPELLNKPVQLLTVPVGRSMELDSIVILQEQPNAKPNAKAGS